MSIEELNSYLNELNDADTDDTSEFQRLMFSSETTLSLTDDEFARGLKVSRPTVSRWRSGKNAPHPLARPGVIKFLRKRTKHQIKKLRVAEEADHGIRSIEEIVALSRN